MVPFSWTCLGLLVQLVTGSSVAVNLSLATCYLPEEGAKLDMFKEWSAYHESGNDGYCYDYNGNGYPANATYIACESCMEYTCMSQSCRDRDGSLFKLWWELSEVDPSCCSDCKGRVIPLNKGMSSHINDVCSTLEKSLCILSASSTGQLEVTFESTKCCQDQQGLAFEGTVNLDPSTCSTRTCQAGSPAFWVKHQIEAGCDCCLLNDHLVPSGATVEANGTTLKCCDGHLLKEKAQPIITPPGKSTTAPTPTLLPTVTTPTIRYKTTITTTTAASSTTTTDSITTTTILTTTTFITTTTTTTVTSTITPITCNYTMPGPPNPKLTMSSLYHSYYPASLCYDGTIQNFCHTKEELNPWLSIKYLQAAWIASVSVTNRLTHYQNALPPFKDCSHCHTRFKEAVVIVGNVSPTANNQIFTEGTQLGAKLNVLGPDATHVFKGDEAILGNVVTIQCQAKTWLHLSEVSVSFCIR